MNSRLHYSSYYDHGMDANLALLISEPRFETYRRCTSGNDELAAELYIHNLRLSEAAYGSLQMCEVVLRNAIDVALRGWSVKQGSSEYWAVSTPNMLAAALGVEHGEIARATDKASKALRGSQRAPQHDDIIAQMSFGTWRYLLPGKKPHTAKDKLWEDCLVQAFPNKSPHTRRETLTDWVSMAYDLRNRVAHHEPIFQNDLRGKRRAIKDVIDAVSRDARKWFSVHDTFSDSVDAYQRFCSVNKLSFAQK